MFRLVLSAVFARRAQAVALFLLAVLAVAAAAAAPWYLAAATDSVAAADVAGATALQRAVAVAGSTSLGTHPASQLDQTRQDVAPLLPVPGAVASLGEQILGQVTPRGAAPDAAPIGTYVAYRDGVCDQLVITGSCPTNRFETIVSTIAAGRLGVGRGDTITVNSFELSAPVTLTVVGTYTVRDAGSPFWVGSDLLAGRIPNGLIPVVTDALLVTDDTLIASQPTSIDVRYSITVPSGLFSDGSLAGLLARAGHDLDTHGLRMTTGADELAQLVGRDQSTARLGVTVAAAQLLLLCWVALFLAARYTADDRRGDIALLKLRGAATWRIWGMTAQQSALPMLAAAVLGWGAGFAAARVLAGGSGHGALASTLLLSLGAAALAGLGALAAAVVAEWASLRSGVSGLLRRVPARRRGWRAEIVDVAVVLLAIAGVYQGHADAASGSASLLSLLAPGLVALALGLTVARIVPWAAAAIGAAALRTGRTGPALAALHLARRPGTNRVFAMVVVAVGVCATSGMVWSASAQAWQRRAQQELGAARVLTVHAADTALMLEAVREADPSGRFAMAVARTDGPEPVLAVDTARLSSVGLWRDEYVQSPAALAGVLNPAGQPSVRVTDGVLTLDAAAPDSDTPAAVDLELQAPGAQPPERAIVTVFFGQIVAQRGQYQATLSGCPAPQGCRVVAVRLASGQGVQLFGLTSGATEVLGSAQFGDITRWRPPVVADGSGPAIEALDGHLSLRKRPNESVASNADPRAYYLDAAAPLPVLLAGALPAADPPGDNRLAVFGSDTVPVSVVATAPVLPQLGRAGMLVDLAAALRMTDAPGNNETMQVWLAPGAPASIVDKLGALGVVVARSDTVATTQGRYAQQGPGAALTFQLFTAAMGVLLAAGLLAVAVAVERRPRAAELAALRTQGVSVRVVGAASYAGYAAVVLAGALAGALAALLAGVVVATSLPFFTDPWSVLPAPSGVAARPLLAALAGSLLVLAVSTLISVRLMVRTVRSAERVREAGGLQ
jgi:hypothetical protein